MSPIKVITKTTSILLETYRLLSESEEVHPETKHPEEQNKLDDSDNVVAHGSPPSPPVTDSVKFQIVQHKENNELDKARIRFYSKVVKEANETGCDIWVGARDKDGYGQFRYNNRLYKAHRFVFLLAGHTLDSKEQPDHLCENPSCVNLDHLEVVDHRTNTLRNSGPSALNSRKVLCPNGHPYDKVTKSGSRRCSICHAANERSRRNRQ